MTLAITGALAVGSPAEAGSKWPSAVQGCKKNYRVGTKVNIYDATHKYRGAHKPPQLVKVRLIGTAEWRYSKTGELPRHRRP
jgi:hypothetical protein